MDLDRGKIERTDFASARRGYEPAEVDAHLREVADAVEDLRSQLESKSERSSSLSGAATERLRLILDAAEASAAEIRSDAEDEARETVRKARREASAATEEAERRAREREEEAERRAREREEESESASAEQVQRMEARTDALLSRADSLDSELEALLDRMRAAAGGAIEGLRAEAETLRTELEEVSGSRGASGGDGAQLSAVDEEDSDVEDTVLIEPTIGAEPSGDEALLEPDPDELLIEEEEEVVVEEEEDEEDVFVADEDEAPAVTTERSARQTPASARASSADVEGARLIALNMALSGSPRAETADYLRDTFGLEDDALLDDVYERVQAS